MNRYFNWKDVEKSQVKLSSFNNILFSHKLLYFNDSEI